MLSEQGLQASQEIERGEGMLNKTSEAGTIYAARSADIYSLATTEITSESISRGAEIAQENIDRYEAFNQEDKYGQVVVEYSECVCHLIFFSKWEKKKVRFEKIGVDFGDGEVGPWPHDALPSNEEIEDMKRLAEDHICKETTKVSG